MSEIGATGPGPAAQPSDAELARLRQVTRQLEGVFVEQLFKAMRETVPADGALNGGAGEEIFSGMLDQHLASIAPADWEDGLGAALYRQLRGALDTSKADPSI